MKSIQSRISSIDHLRGLIMVLMALDHTRDYFSDAHFNPLNLDQTTIGLFLTRWITHFCAPLFIFLSGISAALSLAKTQDINSQAKLLFTRGLMLIVLELTWIRILGWDFGLDPKTISVGVIWAIGWCMVTLSGLIYLRRGWILAFSLILILGHNALDGMSPERFGHFAWIWQILHTGGYIPVWGIQRFHPYYPLVPWLGVMALGYVMGPLFLKPARVRQLALWGLGMMLIFVFILLRYQHGYGDSHDWQTQGSWQRQFLSFIDCTKYPPSLHYLLMTLGPGLISLAVLERFWPQRIAPLAIFGEVPLFFYLMHLPLIHALAVVWDLFIYGSAVWEFSWPINRANINPPSDHGLPLPGVYLVTAIVILLLYPFSKRFAALKQQRAHSVLRYL